MRKFRRIKYGLPLIGAAVVSLALATGMSSYKSVEVSVDGHTIHKGTFAGESVGAFLRQVGIRTTGYDLVEPDRGTQLESNMHIFVQRAKTVWVVNGAKAPRVVHSLKPTVGGLLSTLGIRVRANDSLNHPLTDKIKSGMSIVIRHLQSKTLAQTLMIPYTTVHNSTSSYMSGVSVVARYGQDGVAKIITKEEYVNGRLVKKARTRQIIKQPVSQIVDVGTAQPAPVTASRSNSSIVANEVLTVVATAYANPGGHTATGAPAEYGDVAVDPSVIPLGTKLYIPGYGFAIANDTGGAIQGYRIDLCFNSYQQAIDFGRQLVKVYILKN